MGRTMHNMKGRRRMMKGRRRMGKAKRKMATANRRKRKVRGMMKKTPIKKDKTG